MGTKKKAVFTVQILCLSLASERCAHLVHEDGEMIMVYAPLPMLCPHSNMPRVSCDIAHPQWRDASISGEGIEDRLGDCPWFLGACSLLGKWLRPFDTQCFSLSSNRIYMYDLEEDILSKFKRCHLQKINIFTFLLPENCFQTWSR